MTFLPLGAFETRLLLCDATFALAALVAMAFAVREALGRASEGESTTWYRLSPFAIVAVVLLKVAILLALLAPGSVVFSAARYLAFLGLLALPALAALAGLVAWRASSGLAALLLTAGAVGFTLFVYGFFVQPRSLELVTIELPMPEGVTRTRPLRIALVSDIQTDRVGAYEKQALERVVALSPDLVLFAGDFLQVEDAGVFRAESAKLRVLLADLARRLPPGRAFGVWGNVDWHEDGGLPGMLAGTGVELLVNESRVVEIDGTEVRISGLDLATGFSMSPDVLRPLLSPRPDGGLHLAFAHAPDFAAGAAELGTVDVALAGHTHGGQIVVPLFGPPITFSRLPRATASGLSRLGRLPLVVSKGVGMERASAPRLRLFCPPDITLVVLEPRASAPAPRRS